MEKTLFNCTIELPSTLCSELRDSSLFADRRVPVSPLLPPNAMALSSLGSLGFRCSLRLDVDEDLPRLKNDRQLPTGDFFDFIGCLFLDKKRNNIIHINICKTNGHTKNTPYKRNIL